MNKLLNLFVVLIAFAIAPTAVHAQNLLVNGDLALPPIGDVPPAGWTLVESPADSRDPAQLTDFADHTTPAADAHRGLWLKPFEGNFPGFPDVLTVDADLFQTVPGIPGVPYQMTGWARFEGGYAGGVDNLDSTAPAPRAGQPPLTDTFFALEFLNAGNSVLPGSVVVELKAAGQTNNNQWMQHTLTGVAPAGTVNVRVRASMVDGEFNVDREPGPGQSAFVDDFTLTVVPEPATCLLGLFALGLVGAFRRRTR
jgi:PEP-CTERM motif